jgi:DNA-binding winged helix-turn-helix (wHTH) protein
MVMQFGSFALDTARRQLFRGDTHAHLTPLAYELLVLLVTEAPRVLDKPELHRRLWPDTFVSDATLVGLIKELRKALDDRDPEAPIIRTIHGVGYAFCLPVSKASSRTADAWHWLVMRGRRVALHEGENIIGRDAASDVCLDDPSVSRRHALIIIDATSTRLEDRGSKNGTTVRGQPVSSSVVVEAGDRIVFGSVVAVYRVSGPGDSTQTRSDLVPVHPPTSRRV